MVRFSCNSRGWRRLFLTFWLGLTSASATANTMLDTTEKQLTFNPGGHILTNANAWSPDGQWIVYDVRSDTEGSVFDGTRIEMVNVKSGVVQPLYESKNGAQCGVATFDPNHSRVIFILGPENPTPDWQYGATHRQGVIVEVEKPNAAVNLDGRDLSVPLTPGALRGGSHVHIFSPDSQWVSFTYNDALLSGFKSETDDNDTDLRNIGVSADIGRVEVDKTHPRNHNGNYFSVLVTRTIARPRPGSDDIQRAFEESWIGKNGYVKADGSRQKRALAFQGEVLGTDGKPFSEVFVVDIPDDITTPSPDGPLQGTLTKRPLPPLGTRQRRLTFTQNRKYPGIQGPRHWLRTSPDGAQIAFLMRDDAGAAQVWTVSPHDGAPRQITHDAWGVASAFTWSPDGRFIAYIADNSVFAVEVASGQSTRLTKRSADVDAPSPLACVFSPDGRSIAYLRSATFHAGANAPRFNQIFVVGLPHPL